MTLIEMNGFLKGKCIPSDLKVNETSAEYLVRKFGELESKLETALRECRSAGITIDNLEAKCVALAAENVGMSAFVDVLLSIAWQGGYADGAEIQDLALKHGLLRQNVYSADEHENQVDDPGNFEEGDPVYFRAETPATDAFLAEVRAQGVDAAIEAAKNLVAQEYEYKDFKAAQSDCCMHPGSDLVGKVEMTEWLVDFAAQLRKGGNQ
nr:MAG TPA: hypothetical protein [Caudoviricetes sp.]